jgi:superfamily II helicase
MSKKLTKKLNNLLNTLVDKTSRLHTKQDEEERYLKAKLSKVQAERNDLEEKIKRFATYDVDNHICPNCWINGKIPVKVIPLKDSGDEYFICPQCSLLVDVNS